MPATVTALPVREIENMEFDYSGVAASHSRQHHGKIRGRRPRAEILHVPALITDDACP